VTTDEKPARFIRRFLDTYEAHDLDRLWTFYSKDCSFPVLEHFGMEPSWERYKTFMATFIDAYPDVHHSIDKLVTDGDNIWALYTVTGTHRDGHPPWRLARYRAHRKAGSIPHRGDVPGRQRAHHRSRLRLRRSPYDAPNRWGARVTEPGDRGST